MPRLGSILLMMLASIAPCRLAWGQDQVTITTPSSTVNNSFSENININWGVRGPGFFFNMGGGAAPGFGGGNPAAGAQLGVGFGGGNLQGGLNLTAGQGSQRAITSSAPSVTVMNGAGGAFRDISVSPFVIGAIPVVGFAPSQPVVQPIQQPPVRNWRSTLPARARQPAPAPQAKPAQAQAPVANQPPPAAARGAPPQVPQPRDEGAGAQSLGEIRRQLAAEDRQLEAEARQLLERGQQAEDAGKAGVARIYYQRVARQVGGVLRQEANARLEQLQR